MTEARRAQARPGGKLLADALVAQGVTHAFCVPGESYLDLLDGLYAQRNRIQLVTCRFEAGAVHMAEAYGKLTGRPGVALVTRGPGACHASIGVHVAFQDSTPLVLIVGMLASKDSVGFLGNFTGLARRLIAVPVPGADNGLSPEAVAEAARAIGLSAAARGNLTDALNAVRKLDLEPPPRILITGSLYLAGDVLRENGTLPV